MKKFRIFNNVKSKTGSAQWSLEQAIAFIKGARPDLDVVNELRTHSKGSNTFNKLKSHLPCIVWNVECNGGRKTEDAIKSTGYMYFDIDNATELNINRDYVYASWKSISETGFGVLVRVSGVTLENFKYCYKDVAEALGIQYDKGTNDLLRLNILSYDPTLYHNPDSEIIDYSDFSTDESVADEKAEKRLPINQNSLLKSGVWSDANQQLRMSNIEDRMSERSFVFDENGVCDLKDDKLTYTEVYIPREIHEPGRHNQLSIIAMKLFALNPSASFNQVLSFMKSINRLVCKPPKSDNEIFSIVDSKYKKRDSLFLAANRTKRFFFNDPVLDEAARRSLRMTYINKERGENRQKEVLNCMCDVDSEGTPFKIPVVMKRCKASRNTINKILDFLQEHLPCEFPQNLILKKS
ncbi:BT4734/BF3469 family protein [Chryseobacterium sp. HSC-36S06]|uniref:BT4734/BF3469 family protein n=1 Tax=Chryseobacterium sp. HSC-36S06 TaxID=2910970 RepID=UPI0020A0B411|nr:BT4734/BF3469 family protein [Chryseobacterium sp. HSC-36S06]MCP2038167.1 hypothetical protein [Chryseobacterium sp. HSC-36S06]